MKDNRNGFYIKLSDEEKEMFKELKEKHAINISQLIKNLIKNYYNNILGKK